MNDEYKVAHFDIHSQNSEPESKLEKKRISETVDMVPSNWRRILDVGCGDGQISRELLEMGYEVWGIDWSQGSLARYPGQSLVCDIRKPWPISSPFDGAICCEVLEHFSLKEASTVILRIKENVRQGFLITVPAREPLYPNIVLCNACGKEYHVWGHLQSFKDYEDVDRMVGMTAVNRKLLCAWRRKFNPVPFIDWKMNHGFYPYKTSYVCPHCGAAMRKHGKKKMWERITNKGLSLLSYLPTTLMPDRGWFACRYDM